MGAQMGAKVTYPGLHDHKQHDLLNKLRNADYGYGGMLTIDFGSQQVRAHFQVRLPRLDSSGHKECLPWGLISRG